MFTGAAGVGAELAAGLAAPPNENGLLAVVADVVTGFAAPAPKLNPPVDGAELAAVVAVATVPKGGGAVVGAVLVFTLVGGLNALNPLAPPPKVTELACVTAGDVVG